MPAAGLASAAVELAPGVHWVGALDPHLRNFDIILKTANGTSYNAYVVRGATGVAVIDTVKESFADTFFERLESVARYDEITTIVLNHLEPDHSGALPELLKRAPQAKVYLSSRAQMMLKALLKPTAETPPEYIPVTTDDTVDLGAAPCASCTPPTCTGRTSNAPTWRKRASSSPATSSAAISATPACSTTRWAISASPSSTTTPTSCGPSGRTCWTRWPSSSPWT